jgi:hypothetical protein
MLDLNALRFRFLPQNRILRMVMASRLTYLEPEALILLRSVVLGIEHRKLPGLFIGCGCALGGSAIVIASGKRRSRNFRVYDTFGMIPSPPVRMALT